MCSVDTGDKTVFWSHLLRDFPVRNILFLMSLLYKCRESQEHFTKAETQCKPEVETCERFASLPVICLLCVNNVPHGQD